MSWLPVSLEGLSSTGFIRTSGSMPAAWAWTAWARPISSPSRVTKLFSAMFCPLKGAVRQPSWRKIRHNAAASRLFPAPDMVPCTIMHRAIYSTSFIAAKNAAFSSLPRTAARYQPGPSPQ